MMEMNDEKNKPADEKPEAEAAGSNGTKNQFNPEAKPQPEEPTDSNNSEEEALLLRSVCELAMSNENLFPLPNIPRPRETKSKSSRLRKRYKQKAVSYTHLTLPTKRIV